MDPISLTELPLMRIAPVSMIVILLIYFGWWLRGDSIKILREWVEELKKSAERQR